MTRAALEEAARPGENVPNDSAIRPQARHLHRLLENDPSLPAHAKDLFRRKAIAKSINPDELLARLDGREKTWERLWQQRLEHQVRDLPDFDGVWRRVIRGLRQAGY